MHDNDPKHTSKKAAVVITQEGVNWWKTPAESPDSNPIENLWHELKEYIRHEAMWGGRWKGCSVRCLCDNQGAVHVLRTRTCRDPTLMHLLRCLFFLEAYQGFRLSAVHVAGEQNGLADDLSRNRLPSFLRKAPWAEKSPDRIHPSLPPLLLNLGQDWTSVAWMQRFRDIVTRA